MKALRRPINENFADFDHLGSLQVSRPMTLKGRIQFTNRSKIAASKVGALVRVLRLYESQLIFSRNKTYLTLTNLPEPAWSPPKGGIECARPQAH